MIISRTPFRVSFFGGGTDYPQWYREHGGAVLATTIDKYCYISVRKLPPFFDHRFRVVYSIVENVKEIGEIKHPAVRAVLQWLDTQTGLEIHHDGDLPARSGLGSSSACTVGLIHAMRAGNPQQAEIIRNAIVAGGRDQIEAIRRTVESTGAITYTARAARNEADLAMDALQPLPESPYKEALYALAEFSVERTY